MAATKKNKMIGYGKPTTVEVEIITGAVIVDSQERAVEVLEMLETAQASIKSVQDFINNARSMVTEYQRTSNVKTIQLENRYWRLIKRKTRFWVWTDEDMPTPKPKGAKSLKAICKDKMAGDKSLWNFITKRVPDPSKIDLAVKKGYVSEKEISKAYLERDQAAFIQRYDGDALGDDDEEG